MTASSPETVRWLWEMFFPDVPLTDTRWLEVYPQGSIIQGLRAAAARERAGKPWISRDEENIGKYVNWACQNPDKVDAVRRTTDGDFVLTIPLRLRGSYLISEKDRKRFEVKFERQEDHHIWKHAKGTSGYGRFWCNGRLVGAHVFAFFDHIVGVLPTPGELEKHRLEIAHNCIGNHDCVNPKHLTLATQGVNLQERYATGRVNEPAKEGDYSSCIALPDTQSSTWAPECGTTSPAPPSDILVTPCDHLANTLNDQELAQCLAEYADRHLDDSLSMPEDPYDSI